MKVIVITACILLSFPAIGKEQPKNPCESNVHFCSLADIKKNEALKKYLTFSDDPAGIAVEAKTNGKDIDALFKQYASEHNCSLYVISMMKLVKGLFKGASHDLLKTSSSSTQSNSTDINLKGADNKYIIIEGDKAVCIKKLGLKLPVSEFHPN